MMSIALCILSTALATATGGGDADAEAQVVYRQSFDESADTDFDGFPDGWRRRTGRSYPHYVRIGIVADRSAPAGEEHASHLRMEMDGGAAGVLSPPLAIDPQFAWLVTGQVKTERLSHDRAWISVQFLNDQKAPVGAPQETVRLSGNAGWRTLSLGPLTAAPAEARWVVIGLHVEPTERADLSGAALFDSIQLSRLPRMTIEANRPHLVFGAEERIILTCRASGIADRRPRFVGELYGADGELLTRAELPLVDHPAVAGEAGLPTPADDSEQDKAYTATAEWAAPAVLPGLYRARLCMHAASGQELSREIQFARLSEAAGRLTGEFGWSLPELQPADKLNSLATLTSHAGVGLVKLPVWYPPDDTASLDRAAWFAERLGSRGGRVIGVLDRPPEQARSQFGGEGPLPIATVLADAKVWRPLIDPVMSRLSLKIESWQLGGDADASFVDYPRLAEELAGIKSNLEQYGQEVNLGIVWPWLREPPASDPGAPASWKFLSLTADPPLTATELDAYLETDAGTGGESASAPQRWIELCPLPRSQYDFPTRARDLVERMLIARKHDLQAVYVPDPFSAEKGLFTADAAPGELFLPWRTTAGLIAGARHLGSLSLPGGSRNMLFAKDDQAVLAVWNDRPTMERLYLGDDARQIDLSGRQSTPRQSDGEQLFSVGPLPTFATGVFLPVARWRMSMAIEPAQLASVFGRPQTASLKFQNFFPQGANGTVVIHAPEVWEISPRQMSFELAAGEPCEQRFQVILGAGAASGKQTVRADFEVTADRLYKFSVFRELEVGLGDVYMELSSSLDENGDLVVRQDFINETDEPITFNCLLFAPDRRRIRKQIIRQRTGRQTTVYRLAEGERLVGKTLVLRAEEIGGDRILNYRLVAER